MKITKEIIRAILATHAYAEFDRKALKYKCITCHTELLAADTKPRAIRDHQATVLLELFSAEAA